MLSKAEVRDWLVNKGELGAIVESLNVDYSAVAKLEYLHQSRELPSRLGHP